MEYNAGMIADKEALVTLAFVEEEMLYISGLFKDGNTFEGFPGTAITYTGKTDSIDKWLEGKE